jgi:hypothetical protein
MATAEEACRFYEKRFRIQYLRQFGFLAIFAKKVISKI